MGRIKISLLTVLLSTSFASAATTFTIVADTTTTAPGHGLFTGAGFANAHPAISGINVAFRSGFSGGNGIYTASALGDSVAKIVESGETAPGGGSFASLNDPTVNGSKVAFFGLFNSPNGMGIYTGNVGAAGETKVVDSTDTAPGHGVFTTFMTSSILPTPPISGSNVGFVGSYSGGTGIYSANATGGGVVSIAETGQPAPGGGTFTALKLQTALSGSNIVFNGTTTLASGIYNGTVGQAGSAKIVDTTDTAPGHGAFTSLGGTPLAISGNTVAFGGGYSGGTGIYTATLGVPGVTKVVDMDDSAPGEGPFTTLNGNVSINGSSVAFLGSYSGGSGIYTASTAGGGLTPVLNTGDPLFGSTLLGLGNMGDSAYDGNRIAFQYALSDGRSGVAVATVPEPVSLGLLALGGLTLLRRRPRGRG